MERESNKQQQKPWRSCGFMGSSFTWPPRSYPCSFCKREFRSAQALGGHMNVHRRDRARLRHGASSPPPPLPRPLPPPPAPAAAVMIPNLNYPPPPVSLELGIRVVCSCSSTTLPLTPAGGNTEDDNGGLDLELRLGISYLA